MTTNNKDQKELKQEDQQEKSEIEDLSSLHKCRTELPNIIADLGLDPYELSLYIHLKRIAGDNGACFAATPTLAKKCKMSVRQIQYARKILQTKGLIKVTKRTKPNGSPNTTLVQIIDMWPRNFDYFKEMFSTASHAPGVVHSVRLGGASYAPEEDPIKEDLYKKKKESKPKKETGAKAPLASDDAHFVSKFLYEKLKEKNPKYKKPDFDKWSKEIDSIIKNDDRSKEDLITVINWTFAHKGDYWPIAIQSPRTLRKIFDRAWTEITHLSQKERTNQIFENQTKDMNLRWLKDKIASLTRMGTRGNLGYNNTHASDTILGFSHPLTSPKMIDIVKGWDQFRRR